MKILSWNCHGFKSNGSWLLPIINNYDIVLLQETWLHSFEENELKIFLEFNFFHQSAMPPGRLSIRGRPYGGLAILLKKSMPHSVKIYLFDDNRLLGAKISSEKSEILLLNVYFPVRNHANDDLVTQYISKIQSITHLHDGPVIFGGDFNISPSQNKYSELTLVSNDSDLTIVDIVKLESSTFTFLSKGQGHSSWPDHFIISNSLEVLHCAVISDANPSDHFPITLQLNWIPSHSKTNLLNNQKRSFAWKNIPEKYKIIFIKIVQTQLIDLCGGWKLCVKSNCSNADHHDSLLEIL